MHWLGVEHCGKQALNIEKVSKWRIHLAVNVTDYQDLGMNRADMFRSLRLTYRSKHGPHLSIGRMLRTKHSSGAGKKGVWRTSESIFDGSSADVISKGQVYQVHPRWFSEAIFVGLFLLVRRFRIRTSMTKDSPVGEGQKIRGSYYGASKRVPTQICSSES
jgi:hypothetical protein